MEKIKKLLMIAGKRSSKWGGRGANLCSAPKRRKMDNGM